MKISKIKADCLVAFIHSRLIGLGMDKNEGNIQLAFEDKNISEKARYYGNYFEKKLEKLCTFDKVLLIRYCFDDWKYYLSMRPKS